MKFEIIKIAIVAILLILCSCGRSLPTKYFLLESASPAAQASSAKYPVIGLGPVSLPSYLDRKGIVTRSGEYEIAISDMNLWAESLDKNIIRVLSNELISAGITANTESYPFNSRISFAAKIAIEISHFERTENGDAVLDARFSISRENAADQLTENALIQSPCEGNDYSSTVACMSKAVSELAGKIKEKL